MLTDTICSIATALSPSGIGIIRVSGDNSISIVNKIFKSVHKGLKLNQVKTHTIHYGHIIMPNTEEIIDEVMVSVMKGPHSFTREDVVEINCHGGIMVLENVLKLVLTMGARLSEPGEFTKRAFMNGRIDLSQAEAVIDIINSKTQLSLKSSVNQLNGQLSNKMDMIKNQLIHLIAHIEASIDYPEYDIEALNQDKVKLDIEKIIKDIYELMRTYDSGKLIREGISTAIIGKPNVGKSSLLNAMLKEERAIVTDIPGTTRDVLEEYMNIHGIPLKLVDTAGIRVTDDQIEKIGVQRSKSKLEEADLIIFVLDASRALDEEDLHIIELIKDREVICLFNKMDLDEKIDRKSIEGVLDHGYMIDISAKNVEGIDALEHAIKDMFYLGEIDVNNDLYITNVRHKNALEKALISLNEVLESINNKMPEDCWSIDLKNAYENIGIITGDTVNEDMIKEIFSRFCLGK
ncbi:tRNA modification GTPase and tRNA-U34 5-formylation enzyme [Petrocella atlantisensis]|uniref:tRNA modification GTPase MnmE n=1 Tax=Petrocella atlantisensis TaxID=2173034 RepID=A0A3P7S5Q0_9FIRM|nr:tRNA uridine-5-carboxymethylaminomethyl(34) synthesis GTPase MnmE [Petrocella atlantisensis]VDN47759.1 tRNA modification GTPase and tRNA-U34 5-formylation enzyme [Petrocella atlantisensis]